MRISMLTMLVPAALLVVVSGAANAVPPASPTTIDVDVFADQAAAALRRDEQIERPIPPQYLDQARCIAVFPDLGRRYAPSLVGSGPGATSSDAPRDQLHLGLLGCRGEYGKWASTLPVFVTLRADLNDARQRYVSPGNQLVVLFITDGGAQALAKGALLVGDLIILNANVPGPTNAPVLAWRSIPGSGYTNVDISGAAITFAARANRQLYGSDVDAHQLLSGGVPASQVHHTLPSFTRDLENIAPASRFAGNKVNAFGSGFP